jgi:hypothetical protein
LVDRPQLFVPRGQFLAKYKKLKEIALKLSRDLASGGWQALALTVHGSLLHWMGRESVTGVHGKVVMKESYPEASVVIPGMGAV